MGVVFDGFKDGLQGFLVGGVDVFFALFFDGDEVAFEQGFEVVGYHALFLSRALWRVRLRSWVFP